MPYTRAHDLPSYENPPVNEVAVGFGFAPLSSWNATAPGEFRAFVTDFPETEDHPPLPPLDGRPLTLQTTPPIRRTWYMSSDRRTLIQAQADRLHANWRRVKEEDKYPSFGHVLNTLGFARRALEEFLGTREKVVPTVAEVMYVNHIVEGPLWTSYDDLGGVFADWTPTPKPASDVIAGSCVVTLNSPLAGEPTGRQLTLDLGLATRTSDNAKVLALTISNRGSIESLSADAVEEWCGAAGDEIVRAFTLLTTKEAHDQWKLKA